MTAARDRLCGGLQKLGSRRDYRSCEYDGRGATDTYAARPRTKGYNAPRGSRIRDDCAGGSRAGSG